MSRSPSSSPWRAALLIMLSVAGLVLAVRAERASESRGNRLHRADRLELAAEVYGARASGDDRLRYNLGTTLLRLGSPAAEDELRRATESDDARIRVDAYYNLGLWSLIQALVSVSNDSILLHATRAVEENKQALRLDPTHPDAPWNLAMAQLLQISAAPNSSLGNLDSPNDGPELGEIQIVEGPSPFGQREGFGDQPSASEDESLARGDLEPLTAEEARRILDDGHLDPSTLLGKLMLREGRSRRGRGVVGGPPW